MINTLQITNFQSHKDTTLEFVDGVNVIIGSSDSGKTTIIRAIRWLAHNRPSGESFRSHWGGDTVVRTTLPEGKNGAVVSRIRTDKNRNEYLLVSYENESLFKAVKSEVPEEIQQLLNLNSINLQAQHDGPFLLDKSSGEVAKHFNIIANLDVIDRSIQKVQKWIRSTTNSISNYEERKETLEANLTEYEHLDDFEKDVIALENLSNKFEDRSRSCEQLRSLIESIVTIANELKKHEHLLSLETAVDKTIKIIQEKKGLHVRIKGLKIFIQDCIDTKSQYKELQQLVKKKEQKFKEEFPNVCPLCGQEVEND